MTTLTRRRSPDAREECWQICYGDVRVGTIAKRIGIPRDQAPWGWTCGFYPGSHPGGGERQCEDWAPEPTGYARSRHGGLHSAEGDAILLYGGGEFLSLSARVFAPKF